MNTTIYHSTLFLIVFLLFVPFLLSGLFDAVTHSRRLSRQKHQMRRELQYGLLALQQLQCAAMAYAARGMQRVVKAGLETVASPSLQTQKIRP
jgi:hypothetical protein